MSVILGQGEFRYAVNDRWGTLPGGWSLGDVASVGVDSRDRVYVFNRGLHPMIVLDRDGSFITSWGEGMFGRPHGVHLTADDTIFLTDDGHHVVRQCTLDGKVLKTLGVPGQPKPYMSQQPFCKCTHTALSPSGDIYVSDGYGNACVHKFAPDGRHILTWGKSGTAPGQFNLPHNIICDVDGWVYVADRESHRIQVFDGNGRYETQWNNLHRPSALYMPRCTCPLCYVGECGPAMDVNRDAPNIGPRVSILNNKGEVLVRLGDLHAGNEPGQFISPHGIAVDSHGDIYIGEVSVTGWKNLRPGVPAPEPLHCLHKLTKLPAA